LTRYRPDGGRVYRFAPGLLHPVDVFSWLPLHPSLDPRAESVSRQRSSHSALLAPRGTKGVA
jgi:hypothetical protein